MYAPRSALFRAMQHRNYRIFFVGQLVSLIGTWMQSVAQSWLVYRLTGSAVLLGTVGFASQIPVFLLSPLGGVVADRRERRRILLATQTASMLLALALALLTLSGRIQVWQVLGLAALLGVANGFDIPTRQAFVVELVGRQDLVNAIALNSSMFNGARIVGPAIAGVVVATVGEGWCFFGNAVSYIAVIAASSRSGCPHGPSPRCRIRARSPRSSRAGNLSPTRHRSARCSCCSDW
jgi:MFS family permease